MLSALLALLGCQLIGVALARLTGSPIPGPVLGAVLLALALLVRPRLAAGPLSETAHTILRHLSLLFVPASVGLVQYRGLILQYGLPLLVILVLSSAATLAVTALVFRALSRRDPERRS